MISVPPTGDRYFVVQLVDMGTDYFAYIGTRATGPDGGDFLLVGPRYRGALPTERFTRVIAAPSELVALATRTAIDGAADLPEVVAVQERLRLRSLSAHLGTDAPSAVPAVDFPTYDAAVYGSPTLFTLLNFLLPFHTLPAADTSLLRRIAHLGIGPYLDFDLERFTPEVQAAITAGTSAAHRRIEDRGNALGTVVDGWHEIPRMGTYGTDFLSRSAVAWKFIYTNSPEEALYPIAETDADGDPLTGERDYLLHFPPGRLPPVDAFWSITVYDSTTRLMIDNPIDRYSIGSRTPGLQYDADGSLVLHVRPDPPPTGARSNWLPTPRGRFYLNARAYPPRQAFQNGSYRLPPVRKA